MCHYVLGIGDRHLSNFMVDLHSGGAIGIDFGHAFGTATQVSDWQRTLVWLEISHEATLSSSHSSMFFPPCVCA